MPIEITAAEAGANILAHVAGERLIQILGWRPRQNWLDRVTLLEAIHQDIKGPHDCPTSLMPRWLAHCTFELFNGIAKTDIYLLAERYGKVLAAGTMAMANDTLRDRWLVFVITEALASARKIAITNKPYWRLTEASCELAVGALIGEGLREVANEAAQAAQRAAQSAAREASYRIAIGHRGTAGTFVTAQAEEHSAKAAEAAAEAMAAAAGAAQAALAAKFYLPAWAAKKAAEASRQAAQGWMVAAGAIEDRDKAAAEAAGRLYSVPVGLFRQVSGIVKEGFAPENAYRRMFDRLLDEIGEARSATGVTRSATSTT